MGTIIPLHDTAHEEAQQLLPWYANGTLEESERERVEAHLGECGECRADLDMQRAIGTGVAGISPDVEHGWAGMQARMKAAGEARQPQWFRRGVPIGWALAAQAAAALLIVALMLPGQPAATYHTLGSPQPAASAGNLIVIFDQATDERDLRSTLQRSRARIVDGPTAAGAYVLHVADAERATALTRLRSEASVTLAEPIEPAGAQ